MRKHTQIRIASAAMATLLAATQIAMPFPAVWNCQEMCSRGIPKIMDRQESGGVMRELL